MLGIRAATVAASSALLKRLCQTWKVGRDAFEFRICARLPKGKRVELSPLLIDTHSIKLVMTDGFDEIGYVMSLKGQLADRRRSGEVPQQAFHSALQGRYEWRRSRDQSPGSPIVGMT